jgi:hypothetical protein
MVSPREKPPYVKHSPSVDKASADEGTIRTSRGKARCKSPFPVRHLSVFSTSANYGVAKITRFSSEAILRTMKHTMIYPGLDPSLEVSLHSVV